MSAFSTIPFGYDLDFITSRAGVSVYGQELLVDGSVRITYQSPPPQPGESSKFQLVTAGIENYKSDYLAVARPQKWEQIAAQREDRIKQFYFGGLLVVLDLETKANLAGVVIGLDRNPDITGIDWSLGDGVFVFLSRETLYAMADAAFLYIQACFSRAKALTDEANAATDIDALAAIDITSGWPDNGAPVEPEPEPEV